MRLCHVSYTTPHNVGSSLDVNLLDLYGKACKENRKSTNDLILGKKTVSQKHYHMPEIWSGLITSTATI